MKSVSYIVEIWKKPTSYPKRPIIMATNREMGGNTLEKSTLSILQFEMEKHEVSWNVTRLGLSGRYHGRGKIYDRGRPTGGGVIKPGEGN
jgi:hypothetical protein